MHCQIHSPKCSFTQHLTDTIEFSCRFNKWESRIFIGESKLDHFAQSSFILGPWAFQECRGLHYFNCLRYIVTFCLHLLNKGGIERATLMSLMFLLKSLLFTPTYYSLAVWHYNYGRVVVKNVFKAFRW